MTRLIEYKNAGDHHDYLHFLCLENLVLAVPKHQKTHVIIIT